MNSRSRRYINPLIPIYGIIIVIGTLIGVLSLSFINIELSEQLSLVVSNYMQIRQSESLSSIIISSGSLNLIIVLVLLFSGYCSVGWPIIAFAALFKGISYGVMTGLIYSYFQGTFLYITLTILPFYVASCFVIIFICKDATRRSLAGFRRVKGSEVTMTGYNMQ